MIAVARGAVMIRAVHGGTINMGLVEACAKCGSIECDKKCDPELDNTTWFPLWKRPDK